MLVSNPQPWTDLKPKAIPLKAVLNISFQVCVISKALYEIIASQMKYEETSVVAWGRKSLGRNGNEEMISKKSRGPRVYWWWLMFWTELQSSHDWCFATQQSIFIIVYAQNNLYNDYDYRDNLYHTSNTVFTFHLHICSDTNSNITVYQHGT